MDVEDRGDGLVGDRRERDDFGETGQELGTEIALHDVHQLVVLRDLATVELRHDVFRADVGGEQDEGV